MRLTAAVLPILLACGSTAPRAPKPPADPHASRDAMVRATFARLQAGDVDGLSALGDMEQVFAQAFTCTKPPDFKQDKERHRSRIQMATESASGVEIEVIEIVPGTPHAPEVKKGQEVEGCVAKADLGDEKVDVKIRVKRKGQAPVESTSKVGLIQIGDRFYLEKAPRVGGTPVLGEITRYADAACACKDAACTGKIQVEFENWALELMKSGADLEDDQRVPTQMTRLTDCVAKLSAPPAASFPAPADVAAPPPDALRTPNGVSYKFIRQGSGPKPTASDVVKVHYTGWTTDGKMFDSSITRGIPGEFPLGAVIPGWTEGMQQVPVGASVRLWIPEALAYKGAAGMPAGTLVFDVELLEIVKP